MKDAAKAKAPPRAKKAGLKPAVPQPAAPRPAEGLKEVRKPDKRLLQAGGIFLGLLALFLLANAGYFAKRLDYLLHPPVVQPKPEAAVDPYLRELAGTPDFLRIPSLGVEAPVVEAATRTQAAYRAALKNGVAHLPGTAEPGQDGNAYIFGHSSDVPWSDGRYKTVFAVLPEIKPGAMIYVTDHDGNVYAYEVFGTRVIRPDDLSMTVPDPQRKRTLTLQTSYPVGTALRRFIVSSNFSEELLVK